MTRLIRLSSRALGTLSRVRVYVYDTVDEMRKAAERWAGDRFDDAGGVTHAYLNEDMTDALPVIRLARGHLGTEVLAHEMHHASSILYGVTLDPETPARDVLTNANEPPAYLHGELMRRLVDSLYRYGYYDQPEGDM